MIETDIIEMRATGEVCLGDGKNEVEREESGYGCGLKGGTSVFSQPITEEIVNEGLDGHHHRQKRRSSGKCRFSLLLTR
ncbi:MAG TPA: hypothetical protein VLN73_03155 [Alphaproteobacteria bacterium]|nr:hypothetical protein [Alphaproteobacteria bacterium]